MGLSEGSMVTWADMSRAVGSRVDAVLRYITTCLEWAMADTVSVRLADGRTELRHCGEWFYRVGWVPASTRIVLTQEWAPR